MATNYNSEAEAEADLTTVAAELALKLAAPDDDSVGWPTVNYRIITGISSDNVVSLGLQSEGALAQEFTEALADQRTTLEAGRAEEIAAVRTETLEFDEGPEAERVQAPTSVKSWYQTDNAAGRYFRDSIFGWTGPFKSAPDAPAQQTFDPTSTESQSGVSIYGQQARTRRVTTFASALLTDFANYDIAETAYHHSALYGGKAKYRRDGTTGTASSGDELKFFDAAGSGFSIDERELEAAMVGATTDGVTNYSSEFQKALDSGKKLILPEGIFIVDALSGSYDCQIKGAGAGKTVITSSSDSFVLTIEAPVAALRFKMDVQLHGFSILAKNCIEVNPVKTTLDVLSPVEGFTTKDLILTGTYDIGSDASAGDEVNLPDFATELEPLGIGLKTTKVYGMSCSKTQVYNFGVGWKSHGCVSGIFSNNRMAHNARHIHRELAIHASASSGMGTDMTIGPGNDILASSRMGGVYIKETRADNFVYNYQENKDANTPSMIWYFDGPKLFTCKHNHVNPIGKAGSNHVMAHLDVSQGSIVSDNELQDPGAGFTPAYTATVPNELNINYPDRGEYTGNIGFPVINAPYLRTAHRDPSLFNYKNLPIDGYRPIGGVITDNDSIWVPDTVGSGTDWILAQSDNAGSATVSIVFKMVLMNPNRLSTVEMEVTGGGGNGFMSIKRTDTDANVHSGNVLQGWATNWGTKKFYFDVGSVEPQLELEFTASTHNVKISQIKAAFALRTYGTTAERPDARVAGVGFQYLDTDAGVSKPLFSNGTGWEDATGLVS